MLVYGKELLDWASIVLFGVSGGFSKKTCEAIGVMRDSEIIAVCVYSNYQTKADGKTPLLIEMSIASIDKRWATGYNLDKFFAYPFIQLGLERVQATSSVSAEGVNDFLRRLGFILEGRHRMAHPIGGDAFSWSMLKDECRWVKRPQKPQPRQTQLPQRRLKPRQTKIPHIGMPF